MVAMLTCVYFIVPFSMLFILNCLDISLIEITYISDCTEFVQVT